MNIIKDDNKIRRNARIGGVVTLVSLAVLGGGMYITFVRPELLYISLVALFAGFILSQIGIFYTNRWGRKPRPDQMLDQALKGLDSKYTLYHYQTPVAHLLIGPAGIWNLIPKTQRGKIIYDKNRWRQKGGGLLQGYLRMFAQEGIGRPDLEAESDKERLVKLFNKLFPAMEIPEPNTALVFFHPDVELQAEEAPVPAMAGKKLKEFIRKAAKSNPISQETVEMLQDRLNSQL
jgi:hypothetical protein